MHLAAVALALGLTAAPLASQQPQPPSTPAPALQQIPSLGEQGLQGAPGGVLTVQELAVHAPSDAHDLSSDLSSEWEHSLADEEPAPAAGLPAIVESKAEADADASSNPEIAETVEEVRFYLEHFMTDQARAGIEKLESLTSDAHILDPLRAALETAGQPPDEPEPGRVPRAM